MSKIPVVLVFQFLRLSHGWVIFGSQHNACSPFKNSLKSFLGIRIPENTKQTLYNSWICKESLSDDSQSFEFGKEDSADAQARFIAGVRFVASDSLYESKVPDLIERTFPGTNLGSDSNLIQMLKDLPAVPRENSNNQDSLKQWKSRIVPHIKDIFFAASHQGGGVSVRGSSGTGTTTVPRSGTACSAVIAKSNQILSPGGSADLEFLDWSLVKVKLDQLERSESGDTKCGLADEIVGLYNDFNRLKPIVTGENTGCLTGGDVACLNCIKVGTVTRDGLFCDFKGCLNPDTRTSCFLNNNDFRSIFSLTRPEAIGPDNELIKREAWLVVFARLFTCSSRDGCKGIWREKYFGIAKIPEADARMYRMWIPEYKWEAIRTNNEMARIFAKFFACRGVQRSSGSWASGHCATAEEHVVRETREVRYFNGKLSVKQGQCILEFSVQPCAGVFGDTQKKILMKIDPCFPFLSGKQTRSSNGEMKELKCPLLETNDGVPVSAKFLRSSSPPSSDAVACEFLAKTLVREIDEKLGFSLKQKSQSFSVPGKDGYEFTISGTICNKLIVADTVKGCESVFYLPSVTASEVMKIGDKLASFEACVDKNDKRRDDAPLGGELIARDLMYNHLSKLNVIGLIRKGIFKRRLLCLIDQSLKAAYSYFGEAWFSPFDPHNFRTPSVPFCRIVMHNRQTLMSLLNLRDP